MELIPKIIHFVWLGEGKYTELTEKCIESWKVKLPGYQFIKWDDSNIDISDCTYAQEAYRAKKYAFVSDYVRLKVLYEYGGIYFDTDVEVLKTFDDLLDNEAFAGFENNYALETCVIGSRKGNPVIAEFLEYYKKRTFIRSGGEMDLTPNPIPFTQICIRHGLKSNGEVQILDNIKVYSKEYFSPYSRAEEKISISENTYSIHYFNGSWMSEKKKTAILKRKQIIEKYGKVAGYVFYSYHVARYEGVLQFIKEMLYFLKISKRD